MLSKKGSSIEVMVYYIPALAILIILIALFSVFFFVQGIASNPNLIIKSEAHQDSSKLLTILQSETTLQENGKNLTIAELVSSAINNEERKQKLSNELEFLVSKLPLPAKGEDLADVNFATPSAAQESLQKATWNLGIEVNNENFLHIGETNLLGKNYFEQEIIIPLENKNKAKIKLHLECFSCSKEALNAIA